jgi:hypothetical protein
MIAMLAQYFSHRATRELEIRSKREEVLRNLRWAAELAVSEDVAKARLGIQELQALRNSKMLSPSEEGFIDAALLAAVEVPRQLIVESAGDIEVVVVTDPDVTWEPPVSSEEGEEQEGENLWQERST